MNQSHLRCTYHHRDTIAIVLGACLAGLACHDHATTWSAEARSPDSRWLATARTEQWGGPGTASAATSVFLKQGSQDAAEVLGFSHGAPTMNLTMEWVTPKHFKVAYGPIAHGDSVTVSFQAVRIADIEITLRQIPESSRR
jgi:hypothetical protein